MGTLRFPFAAKGNGRAPIFVGGLSGGSDPAEQPGSEFSDREFSWDDGRRTFLVHPDLPRARWPKKGDKDAEHPQMFVTEVRERLDASSLIELEVSYRGITDARKRVKVRPGVDTQMAALIQGEGLTINVPVPRPNCSLEFVAVRKPSLGGGQPSDAAALALLPTPEPFVLLPLGDGSSITENYYKGWVLQSRSWEDVGGVIWLVRERHVFYHAIG